MEITFKNVKFMDADHTEYLVEDLCYTDDDDSSAKITGNTTVVVGTALANAIEAKLKENNIDPTKLEVANTETDWNTIPDEKVKYIVISSVQGIIDAAASSMGYDNAVSCASYATSNIPKFKAEAAAIIKYRDDAWIACYQFLNDYLAGKIKRPTLDVIMAKIPTFVPPSV